MKTYLAIMNPENPYTFSTDQKSRYDDTGETPTGKESYYIESKKFPEQTSIWGMLRLLMLEQAGLLHSNFDYSEQESESIKELIGAESFDFSSKGEQDFGKLLSISPVFLCEYGDNGEVQYIVKNPKCNICKKGFSGLSMKEICGETDYGTIHLPDKYEGKTGPAEGYINLTTHKCYSDDDLFKRVVQTGNRKNKNGNLIDKAQKSKAFFRRSEYVLKKGERSNRCFAFFVKTNDVILRDDIVTVGAGKNIFSIRFVEKEEDLEGLVRKLGDNSSQVWGYALSDIVLQEVPKYDDFVMVDMRFVRNIITKAYKDKLSYHSRFSRTPERTVLIQRGSVFYNNCFKISDDEAGKSKNLKKLGYNKIIVIGGDNK
ncbi:CRISPR-associated RAMP Cmr3 [Anaerovibrio sp. JC8]|uniref:hypothetical protein n=1 Tax=Anaerovibrio sp. JC8 TaxID=1240085 RepID=UPI000A0CE5FC|nr:hypothetical protein [Anaerovibrio sp. JC8]ORU00266.1 CRISPR-associated RAMP Cmr3 [Anaerovibrio sp. JC8]